MNLRGVYFLFLGLTVAAKAEEPCMGKDNTFTVKLDLFAGELGYYQFEECGDKINPTIAMEIGETYTFVQADPTNYYHPLGFAYFADGAHADVDELEPGITQTPGNTCADDVTCSSPMYFLGGKYLGTYSNIPEVANVTTGEDNFGLDEYEPLFFHPLSDWASYGEFSVKLRFNDADYDQDIFYFCHIHQYMTGRIKLLKSGQKVNADDSPALDYAYDKQGEFDKTCGTFGLDGFTLPRSFCPSAFVCGTEDATDNMKAFSKCIDAMNCHMFAGQTTNIVAGSANALFMHQMIPHHQNAVNMAKTLIHAGVVSCDDVTAETEDCVLYGMMLSIITGQNFQIQAMKNLLAANPDYPLTDNCDLNVDNSAVTTTAAVPDSRLLAEGDLCISENNIFTVKVNLFAGELGYYEFEECEGKNPTIGMKIGEAYTFVQADPTNYFHPMGFAYFPDGAHDEVDELEPGVTQTPGNTCAQNMTCSAPMYFMGNLYLGTYSNMPNSETIGEDNFGLDEYEPRFFHPFPDWHGYGDFNIKLRFTDEEFDQDIFYFCHIHQYMSGRIKLLKGDTKVNAEDTPVIEYTYDEPSEFDLSCGTFALGDFVLPQEICPDRFVCSTEGASAELKKFVSCMDAMNCHMLGGMTTNIVAGSEKALFMHQMIPHHQNAVNMAKALLHSGSLQCDDLSDDSEEDCVLQSMMYEIINEQNYQIQTMRVLLADNAAYPESDNCVVAFPEHSVVGQAPSPTGDDSPVQAPPTTGNDSPVQAPSSPTGDDSPAQAPSSEGSTPSGAVCSVHYSSLAFAFGLLALSSTSVVWMM